MANVTFLIESSKSDLSSKARLVLNCLALHCRKDTDSCFPSIKTIGKEAGISRSTVIRAIKELIEVNIVKKVARFSDKKNGGQTSNMYFLNLNYNEEKEEPKEESKEVSKEPVSNQSAPKETVASETVATDKSDDKSNSPETVQVAEIETEQIESSIPIYESADTFNNSETGAVGNENYRAEVLNGKEDIFDKLVKNVKSKLKTTTSKPYMKHLLENKTISKMPIFKGLKWGRVSQ